jgi:hypothetical protein
MHPIKQSMVRAAQSVRIIWHAMVPEGTTIEDVMTPGYWVHAASQLQPGGRIEVVPEGFGWYAELLIVGKSTHSVETRKLSYVELDGDTTEQSVDDRYRIRWAGPQKFQVLDADRNVIGRNFENKDVARRFIATLEPRAA